MTEALFARGTLVNEVGEGEQYADCEEMRHTIVSSIALPEGANDWERRWYHTLALKHGCNVKTSTGTMERRKGSF